MKKVNVYRGYTVRQLTRLLNDAGFPVSERTVYRWASGKSSPSNIYQTAIEAVIHESEE